MKTLKTLSIDVILGLITINEEKTTITVAMTAKRAGQFVKAIRSGNDYEDCEISFKARGYRRIAGVIQIADRVDGYLSYRSVYLTYDEVLTFVHMVQAAISEAESFDSGANQGGKLHAYGMIKGIEFGTAAELEKILDVQPSSNIRETLEESVTVIQIDFTSSSFEEVA